MESEARRRGVTLALQAAAEAPDVVARADELQQLSLNLVKNALEACDAGAQVSVRLARDLLRDPGLGERGALLLQVQDTGRGMEETTAARAFEPFFTTRAAEGGTGLGLAVCKSIVDDLGGRIEITSERGRGTTVTVRVPAVDPPEAP